jgi:subtilisin-like proprotein convertase family protein
VGTSFSAPAVSGVVALMLEANPELGWRDVQAILAATARKVDSNDESWTTNAAGVSHSYKYGFGLVDAYEAVQLSYTWQNWEVETQMMIDSDTLDLSIPDDSVGEAMTSITVTEVDLQDATGVSNFTTESVVVYLDLFHQSRGDLSILLTSPSGTECEFSSYLCICFRTICSFLLISRMYLLAILAPSKRPETQQLPSGQKWKLMTLRNWGESPVGDWNLTLLDEKEGAASECVDLPWEATVNGITFTCADATSEAACQSDVGSLEFDGNSAVTACCSCGGGLLTSGVENSLRSWQIVIYGHGDPVDTEGADIPGPVENGPATSNGTCNFNNELCSFDDLFDGECSTDPCADSGDCFDCDSCRIEHSYDCASCVQNGCVWCPGDAVCMSTVGLNTDLSEWHL